MDKINKKSVFGWSLLFIVMLVISLLIQTPAAWVLSNKTVTAQLGKAGIELSSVEGSVWNAKADLFVKKQYSGQVSWQLNALNLLWLNTDVDVQWQFHNSKLQSHLNISMLNPAQAQIEATSGHVNIDEMVDLAANHLPPQLAMVKEAKGGIEITQFDTMLDLNSGKTQNLKAQADVKDLALIGNVFKLIKLDAQQAEKGQTIKGNILSEGQTWNLTGEFILPNLKSYQGQVEVKAASEEDLPDWAFMMRKKSPTHYTLRF